MDFNTFLANILSSIIAGVILAPLFWVIVRNSPGQVRHFCLRRFRSLFLRVRFLWLVVTRKRRWSGFKSWSFSERVRRYVLSMVSDVPAAKQESKARLHKSVQDMVTHLDRFDSVPPIEVLSEAANTMTINKLLGHSSEPLFSSLSVGDRGKWLNSQSLNDMARLSLRMNEDDRNELMSWLKSPNCVTELESTIPLGNRG